MNISIENFSGIAPLVDKRRLAPELAQIAEDCVFDEKTLRPLRAPLPLAQAVSANTKTLQWYQSALLEYAEYVDIVKTPVLNDAHDRLFLTDSAYPKVKSGASTYRLGIPRPTAPPGTVAVVIPDPDSDEQLLESDTVFYVFTYVDSFGAEGPNSPVSTILDKVRDTDVYLTFPAVPSGNYNFGSGALIRIYRSNTGSSDTEFQFVSQQPITTATWTDSVANALLQEVLPSATWIGPPDDDEVWTDGPLQGLTAMPNGVLAGFSGKTIHFCEPKLPHAWPLAYRISVQDNVVGLVHIASGLLVLTEGKPVLIVGSDPQSFDAIPLQGEAEHPCIAKQSIVDMGDYAIYATDRGLALAEGNKVVLATEQLIDKEDWVLCTPTSVVANSHLGRYVAFYDTGTVQAGVIFDPSGGKNALTTTTQWADAMYHSPFNGSLYVKQGTSIGEWDAGIELTYTWKSKNFILPQATSFSFFELLGDVTSTTVTFGHGGFSFEITATKRFSILPGVFPVNEWWVQLVGTDNLLFAGLYEDMGEAA